MTQSSQKHTQEFDFNCDLKFDETECGAAQCSYYALLWDHASPANILIRRNSKEEGYPEAIAKEVVKRWNCHDDLLEALKKFIADHENTYDGQGLSIEQNEVINSAYAAIAKATGEA